MATPVTARPRAARPAARGHLGARRPPPHLLLDDSGPPHRDPTPRAPDQRFLAGIVLGAALVVVLAMVLTTLIGRPAGVLPATHDGPIVLTSEDVAAAATPTPPAWPFRAEWLTPRPMAR
ncbi:MAG TPA: hypothetical protein VFC93_09700 [Chloroflexota bacterium]|jgi:hypothetical protein|nr:hypothetical protein [Chloroflexota bacterium]